MMKKQSSVSIFDLTRYHSTESSDIHNELIIGHTSRHNHKQTLNKQYIASCYVHYTMQIMSVLTKIQKIKKALYVTGNSKSILNVY